jgi:hypothetical protein
MKSVTLKLLGTLFILLVIGCGRGFYYSNDTVGTEVFTIDENTEIYARKLYAKENEFKGRELTSATDDTLNGKGMLTEVQYLIFNKEKVIYISTVSSRYIYDKTDSYLIKNSSGKNSYPNSFFFNSFYFGNYNTVEETLEFKNEKTAQDWKIRKPNNYEVDLLYINNFNFKKVRFKGKTKVSKNFSNTEVVDQSVQNTVSFEKIKYFKFLSFKTPNSKNDYDKTGALRSKKAITYNKANTFCIVFKEGKKQKVKYLFIPFSDELIPGYKALKFNSNRVRYY